MALGRIAGSTLAVVCAVAAGGGDSDETTGPTIAIVRLRTGSPAVQDLVTVGADGHGLRVIAGQSLPRGALPGLIQAGGWSPDGRLMAFSGRERGAAATDLYVGDPGDAAQRRLTRLGDVIAPVGTPGGGRIVFTRTRLLRQGQGALWSVDSAGRGLRRITRSIRKRVDVASDVSRTGDRLAITRRTCSRRGPGCDVTSERVYTADLHGSDQHLVATDASDAAFSPDGTRIAFVSTRDRNGSLSYAEDEIDAAELYVSDTDGRNMRRLSRTRDVNEANPSWSPDGTRIAFQRGRVIQNAKGASVWQVNADGTCARAILADRRLDVWYSSPAWRPVPDGPGRLAC